MTNIPFFVIWLFFDTLYYSFCSAAFFYQLFSGVYVLYHLYLHRFPLGFHFFYIYIYHVNLFMCQSFYHSIDITDLDLNFFLMRISKI